MPPFESSIPLNGHAVQAPGITSSNGHNGHTSVREAAIRYINEGCKVIVFTAGQKYPTYDAWQEHALTLAQANALDEGVNTGILTGAASGGRYDVDCDVPQARKAWEHWGQPTDRVHGRPGNPASHYWYQCVDEPDRPTVQFIFPEANTAAKSGKTETMYIELRGGNDDSASQTMVPPSLHPDGERLEWTSNGEMACVLYADLLYRVTLSASAALVARHWPDKGSRDFAAMALAGGLVRGTDWTDDEIDEFTTMVARLASDEEQHNRDKAARTREQIDSGKAATGWPKLAELLVNGEAVVKRLLEWLDIRPSGKDKRGRPSILVGVGIKEMERKVLAALAKANDPALGEPHIYERNGKLVRIHYDENSRPIVAPLRLAGLMGEIDDLVQFQARYKDGTPHPVTPPKELVAAVLEAADYNVPALAGISEVPLLRPDGSVLATPGYDAATGMLYRPLPGAAVVPTVPDDPTDSDIEQAVSLLEEAIGQFPYASEADRAHAYAQLLTPVLRAALGDAVQPLALGEAPAPGTGKSLLAEVTSITTTGTYASTPTPTDEAEWGKVISSALLMGRPVNVFDNATGLVDSAALSSVLTSRRVSPRLLGKNEMPDLLNNATWMMTGNNLRLSTDIARRTYRIRLDAKTEKPWKRTGFTHPDLRPWVAQNRHRLLHAVLVLARAWYARGKPVSASGVLTMGNYLEWATAIGGILATAGITGFLTNQDKLWDEADTSQGEWEAFLSAWYAAWGDKTLTSRDVYEAVRLYDKSNIFVDASAERPAVRNALPGTLADALHKPGTFTRQMGYAMRGQVDTIRGEAGYRVVFAGKDRDSASLWKVECTHEQ